MKPRYVLLAVFMIVMIASVTAGLRSHWREQASEIPSPAHWVPYEADLTMVGPDRQVVHGRHYRRSDASIREDFFIDGQPPLAMIANLETRFLYSMKDGRWRSRRLKFDGAAIPPRFRLGMEGLSRSADPHEAFDVYMLKTPAGGRELRAPGLNFDAVRVEDANGATRVLTNIKIGEPSADLFQPPSGAEVELLPGTTDPANALRCANRMPGCK